MFAWFGGRLLGLRGGEPASEGSWYEDFERAAREIAPGASGLVALDWWNGNRSILADADLSGVIAGLTLATTPVEVYRALLESVAFGTRRIVENFRGHGVAVEEIVACGGIAERSSLMMQLLADVTGLAVTIPASSQIPARGAALSGAIAGRITGGRLRRIRRGRFRARPGDVAPLRARCPEPLGLRRGLRSLRRLARRLGPGPCRLVAPSQADPARCLTDEPLTSQRRCPAAEEQAAHAPGACPRSLEPREEPDWGPRQATLMPSRRDASVPSCAFMRWRALQPSRSTNRHGLV